MFMQQIAQLQESTVFPRLHPQVEKSIARLLLLRDGISPVNILNQIAPWQPTEQLFHLEFLNLKISNRISQAITSQPQESILVGGHCYCVDFKVSLRDEEVFPTLPPILYYVELDGRGFHDRTREEFVKERHRLRELQRHGGRVYVFAGEEIFKNAARCVLEVVVDLERELIQRRHMITSAWCR
jgi:hypothetical protein